MLLWWIKAIPLLQPLSAKHLKYTCGKCSPRKNTTTEKLGSTWVGYSSTGHNTWFKSLGTQNEYCLLLNIRRKLRQKWQITELEFTRQHSSELTKLKPNNTCNTSLQLILKKNLERSSCESHLQSMASSGTLHSRHFRNDSESAA